MNLLVKSGGFLLVLSSFRNFQCFRCASAFLQEAQSLLTWWDVWVAVWRERAALLFERCDLGRERSTISIKDTTILKYETGIHYLCQTAYTEGSFCLWKWPKFTISLEELLQVDGFSVKIAMLCGFWETENHYVLPALHFSPYLWCSLLLVSFFCLKCYF